MRAIRLSLCLSLIAAGCSSPGKDSHTEVFKTPEQAARERATTMIKEHQKLAVSVLKNARPDVAAQPAEGASITVTADGVSREIDLTPIEDELNRQANQERNILRRYLGEQLRPFDVERLKTVGFAKAKPWVTYDLVNGRDLDAMQKAAGEAKVVNNLVLTNLYRVAVVRRTDPVVTTTVTSEVLDAWRATPAQVDEAATANLKKVIAAGGLFEPLTYGGMGRTGTLKPQVPAAVITLPEFLESIRRTWDTSDDLVIFAPSAGAVTFAERRNERLLNVLSKTWRSQLASSNNPLCAQLLLRTADKLVLFTEMAPAVTTKPVAPPASRPYIVH